MNQTRCFSDVSGPWVGEKSITAKIICGARNVTQMLFNLNHIEKNEIALAREAFSTRKRIHVEKERKGQEEACG